jgi:hypothetical protein
MQVETESLRSGVIARRVGVLAVAALILGAGIFLFSWTRVEQAATAELSFNPDSAYLDDASLAHTLHPAVAAAQTVLTDAVVGDLLDKAGDSVAGREDSIGEFRSRLRLEQRSLETLQVRYRDPDRGRANALANAVAAALAEWTPAPAAAPASGAAETPAWQNPFQIAHLARTSPGLLAQPVRLAAGVSVLFFVTATLGGFLYGRREIRAAKGALGYTLLPPMFAEETEPAQTLAPEAAAAQEPMAAEAEDAWASASREPEMLWPPDAAESEELDARPAIAALAARGAAAIEAPEAAQPALAAATEKAAELSAGSPADVRSGRGFMDSDGNDAEWNTRILQMLARTSIGQRLEAERSSARVGGVAAGSCDGDETRDKVSGNLAVRDC